MSIARSACPGNPWNAQPPHGVITEITSQVRRKHMVGDIYGISMVYLWGLQELFYPETVPRVQTRSKHLKTRNFMQLQASAAQSRKKRFLCSTSHL